LDPVDEVLFPDECRCLFGKISVFLKEAGMKECAGKLCLPGVVVCVTGVVDPREWRFLLDGGGSLGVDECEDKEMELVEKLFRIRTGESWCAEVFSAFDDKCLALPLPLKNTKMIVTL
jgi:hypothetical protein